MTPGPGAVPLRPAAVARTTATVDPAAEAPGGGRRSVRAGLQI
ncbi:hypothetical protein [Streptomyces sioyaensis]